MTFPIILVHGVARFDILWASLLGIDNTRYPFLDRLHYFRGIRGMLLKKGFTAFHAHVSWAAGVDRRAGDLKKEIIHILEETNASKVNIIAHSMGGLDARHLLFNDRNKDRIHTRIASITTLSTPHEGSSVADLAFRRIRFITPVLNGLGIDTGALHDLKTDTCKAYNHRSDVVEFEKMCEDTILFQTFAGQHTYRGVSLFHKPSHTLLNKAEGDNDGMVSVQSAKWRERYFKGILNNVDHFNELGWWSPDQIFSGESPGNLLKRVHVFYAEIANYLP